MNFNESSAEGADEGASSKSPYLELIEYIFPVLFSNRKLSLCCLVSKESAPEDASIVRYSDFESDRSAVGRLRRRAFGEIS